MTIGSVINSVIKGVAGNGGGAGGFTDPPEFSISFDSSETQSLSRSASTIEYNLGKFAISAWVNRASIGEMTLFSQYGGGSVAAFYMGFDNTNRLIFQGRSAGSSSSFATNAQYTDTDEWMHILVIYDYANATEGNRLRLWVDGAEIVSFLSKNNPSEPLRDSAEDFYIGVYEEDGFYYKYNGLIYQAAIFSTSLPSISDVYDSGSPKAIIDIPGIFSVADVHDGDVTNDSILSTPWTNNNTTTASSTIP